MAGCSVTKHIAIDAGGLQFDFRAGQIGHSVDNGSPPLRRFFVAVLHSWVEWKKIFSWNRKKCSSQILANGLKLLEKWILGVAPIFPPATPQNVIATDDAGGNSYILSNSYMLSQLMTQEVILITGRRVMVYGSKSAEIPCSYLC